MKVVHFGKFYPPHRGGMETFLETLSKGLVQRGVECKVIVAHDKGDPDVSNDNHNGVHVKRMCSLGTIKSVPVCPRAVGIMRGIHADVINLHHPNPLADLSYILSKPKGRLVVTYHSDIINQTLLSKLHAPLLDYILQKADAIVATSKYYVMSSSVLKKYQEKIHVIPLGYQPHCTIENKSQNYTKSTVPIFMAIGRLVPYKGISVIIEALRFVPGKLWIVGTGPLEKRLKQQAIDANLNGRVEFLGNVSDEEKLRRLEHCDAFVLPSLNRAEAFGIVLLEAMAMGRPVVVSDLPTGVRLLVEHGVNGFRFPPGNARALAALLEVITRDKATAIEMGKAGRCLVQKYTADRMVDQYLRLYKGLCTEITRPEVRVKWALG
jgi:glycosyltransferase involved in cell wall biosynthesis